MRAVRVCWYFEGWQFGMMSMSRVKRHGRRRLVVGGVSLKLAFAFVLPFHEFSLATVG